MEASLGGASVAFDRVKKKMGLMHEDIKGLGSLGI